MNNLFPRVLQAIPAPDFHVYAYMNDGTIHCVDVRPMIEKGGVFAPLLDPDTFCQSLTVLNDTVAWDLLGARDLANCIDIDPIFVSESPQVPEPNP